MKLRQHIILMQLASYVSFAFSHETNKEGKQPNIVLIVADDFGYNDVGYHNPYVLTPNIDELARTGIILEKNYVQPLCTPTRSALLTGVYPYLMGRQGNPLMNMQPTGLTLDKKLLPQYLKEQGYVTHAIGKWHLGFCKEEYLPTSRGFDSHYGYWGGMEDYLTHTSNLPSGYDFVMNNVTDWTAENIYSEHLFANRFTTIIQENNASNPLFVYMAHQATHTPLDPPEQYLDLYPDIEDDTRKSFFGTATSMDFQVGRMVQDLKDSGLYENTIIIFLGDNGGLPRGGGNNWPLRGEKGQAYEGGVRTPGFIHSPLLNNSGLISTRLTHVTDWLPTILHLAGATQQQINSQQFSGVNQWDSLLNPSIPDIRTEIVVNLDDDQGETVGALIQGKYKLVKYSGKAASGWFIPPEWNNYTREFNTRKTHRNFKQTEIGLYDLSTDEEEKINLVEALPEIFDAMSLRMEELKLDMVERDEPHQIPGGIKDGAWTTGWC